MKKIIKILSATVFILVATAMLSSLSASPPNPGFNGNDDPVGGPPIGGGAPLGSGIVMMASMAVSYGARKDYDARCKVR
jgi:hypothetical protein